jgi:hypothetical protein
VDDIVERIMAFDKNKDGKVTKDELPERLHYLIDRGDLNKDGALDRDEIRKLASAPGGLGQIRPLPAARGPEGARAGFRVAVADVRPRLGVPGGDALNGVVDDLKLPAKKKDRAMAIVKAHQEHVRKLLDQARADMLAKMKAILSEEEFKDFKAAMDRPRGATVFLGPGARPNGRP